MTNPTPPPALGQSAAVPLASAVPGVPAGSLASNGSNGVTNPQYAQIDFSHYMPPGVYTQAMPGPQLAVNSSQPTAVGLFGQALNYRTNVQTVQIPTDTSGPTPVVSIATTTTGAPAVNDVQTITVGGAPTAGTFTLGYAGTEATLAVPYNAHASTVLDSLETIPGLAPTGGANDVQTITITGAPTGGYFTLTFGGVTTGEIVYSATATAASVQDALLLSSTTSPGSTITGCTIDGNPNVSVTGPNGGPYTVTFVNDLGFAPQGPISITTVSGTTSTLTGGTSPGGNVQHTVTGAAGTPSVSVTGAQNGPYTVTFVGALAASAQPVLTVASNLTPSTDVVTVAHTVTGAAPVNEVQTVTVTLPAPAPNTGPSTAPAGTGATFSLQFTGVGGAQTTGPIAYNAPASTVQTALASLSSIGTNNGIPNVTVSGPAGGPYVVTFVGLLAAQNVGPLMNGPDLNTTPGLTQTLAYQGIDTATITVTNPTTGALYTFGTDYKWITTGGTLIAPQQPYADDPQITDPYPQNTLTYALYRIPGGAINAGNYIQVSYQYTDPSYYLPAMYYDYSDVVAAYGAPFNLATGLVQSELTLGAKFAFLNGASQVMCVAVQPSTSITTTLPDGSQVTSQAATVNDYMNALDLLEDQPVAVVVPCADGGQPLQQYVRDHVDIQSLNRFERRAILGVDGSITPVPSSQRQIDATGAAPGFTLPSSSPGGLNDSRCMLVSPATFDFYSPELGQTLVVGGQFIAASLAGLTVAMSAAMPLTRKILFGWSGVVEFETSGLKNQESAAGLCVIEKSRTGQVQVRHGVSTNNTDMLSREWSIIGQQDAMTYRLRDYLESANLIGQPIYPFTLVNVKGSAEAALQSLIRDGIIVNYTGLKVRQLATNPDVLEVSYAWLPAFPLNYIVVTFSVSLTAGNLTQTSVGVGGQPANQMNLPQGTAVSQQPLGAPSSSVTNDFGGPANTLQST